MPQHLQNHELDVLDVFRNGTHPARELVSKVHLIVENRPRKWEIPSWHLPYAQVLLENDSVKLPGLIAVAEHAISDRLVERLESPISKDEYFDLMSASKELVLKKASTIGARRQRQTWFASYL